MTIRSQPTKARRRAGWPAILLSLALAMAAAWANDDEPNDAAPGGPGWSLYRDATAAEWRERDFAKALRGYDRLLAEWPDTPYAGAARCYRIKALFQLAATRESDAATAGPQGAGDAPHGENAERMAFAALQEFLRDNASSPYCGEALLTAGDYLLETRLTEDGAGDYYDRASAWLDRAQATAEAKTAGAGIHIGDWENDIKEGIAPGTLVNPATAPWYLAQLRHDVLVHQGLLAFMHEDYAGAAKTWDQLLATNPERYEGLKTRGYGSSHSRLMWAAEKTPGAIYATPEQMRAIKGKRQRLAAFLGDLYYVTERPQRALTFYQRMLAGDCGPCDREETAYAIFGVFACYCWDRDQDDVKYLGENLDKLRDTRSEPRALLGYGNRIGWDNSAGAAKVYRDLMERYPQTEEGADACFLLGRDAMIDHDYSTAAAAFQQYLTMAHHESYPKAATRYLAECREKLQAGAAPAPASGEKRQTAAKAETKAAPAPASGENSSAQAKAKTQSATALPRHYEVTVSRELKLDVRAPDALPTNRLLFLNVLDQDQNLVMRDLEVILAKGAAQQNARLDLRDVYQQIGDEVKVKRPKWLGKSGFVTVSAPPRGEEPLETPLTLERPVAFTATNAPLVLNLRYQKPVKFTIAIKPRPDDPLPESVAVHDVTGMADANAPTAARGESCHGLTPDAQRRVVFYGLPGRSYRLVATLDGQPATTGPVSPVYRAAGQNDEERREWELPPRPAVATTLRILDYPRFVYSYVDAAVPIRFRIDGLGKKVWIDNVAVRFSVAGTGFSLPSAPFAAGTGFGEANNGTAREYTAWVPMAHFKTVATPEFVVKGGQLTLAVTARVPGATRGPGALTAATTEPIEFGRRDFPAAELGTVSLLPLTTLSRGRGKYWHLSGNACSAPYPHEIGATGDARCVGLDACGFDDCGNEPTFAGDCVILDCHLTDNHWFAKSGETVRSGRAGAAIIAYFAFSYGTRQLALPELAGQTGMDLEFKKGKDVYADMLASGGAQMSITGSKTRHDTAVDYSRLGSGEITEASCKGSWEIEYLDGSSSPLRQPFSSVSLTDNGQRGNLCADMRSDTIQNVQVGTRWRGKVELTASVAATSGFGKTDAHARVVYRAGGPFTHGEKVVTVHALNPRK